MTKQEVEQKIKEIQNELVTFFNQEVKVNQCC